MFRRESLRRFGKFLVVGSCAATVDFTSLSLLHRFLAATAAFSIAYVAGVITHFLLNKYWTFRCARTDLLKQVAQYGLVMGLVYLLQLAVFRGVLAFWPVVGIYGAKALAIPPGTFLGYFLYKTHVFEHALPSREADPAG